jgi:hypothetical protein
MKGGKMWTKGEYGRRKRFVRFHRDLLLSIGSRQFLKDLIKLGFLAVDQEVGFTRPTFHRTIEKYGVARAGRHLSSQVPDRRCHPACGAIVPMNKVRKLNFIQYNGEIHISDSFLSVVLHD